VIKFSKGKSFIKPDGVIFYDDKKFSLPKVAIGVFSKHLYDKMIENNKCYEVGYIETANAENSVYIMDYKGSLFTFFLAGVGGPLIASGLEDLIESGVEKFIIFGNCGCLDSNIKDCDIIIPNLAYREDGTSQHYIPDSETIEVNPKYKEDFIKILKDNNYNYFVGPTWTTDALFRETEDKIQYFQEKGVLTVEMEGSTIAAVCKYHSKDYFTFYYAGDLLDSPEWERRSISGRTNLAKKEEVSNLALEMGKVLIKKR